MVLFENNTMKKTAIKVIDSGFFIL